MSSPCGIPKKFDYLILGGGTSGCLMARRLSDDPRYSVGLIEAGAYRDNDPLILNSTTSIQNEAYANYFWQETTVPQVNLQGRILEYTGGRLFGGSSSINGSQWVRSSREKYDEWVSFIGDPAWGPDNVVNIFVQIENYHGTSEKPATRGTNGLLSVRQVNEPISDPVAAKITNVFLTGAQQAGVIVPLIDDYNTQPSPSPPPPNAVWPAWQVTQSVNPADFGTRVNSSIAYLDSVITLSNDPATPKFARGNGNRKLFVFFESTVVKIHFKGNKAVGARFIQDGKQIDVCAKKVIVTAGINSAWLLQVSGVGPADVLTQAGVPVIVNNPEIGKHLQDHLLIVPVFLNTTGDKPIDVHTNYVGGAFLPDPRPGSDPNIRAFEFQGFYVQGSPIFVIVMYLVRPKSEGTVNIFARDPLQVPLPNPNYLGDPDDVALLTAGIQTYLLNFITLLAGQGYIPLTLTPATINDPAALAQYIAANAGVSYHYSSSVRMATQAQGGAVDTSGRVYGARNLIVADDSIQPIISDSNPQANAYLIGWKISQDLINERPL